MNTRSRCCSSAWINVVVIGILAATEGGCERSAATTSAPRQAPAKAGAANPEIYRGIRSLVLSVTPDQLQRTNMRPDEIVAVVMDWPIGNGMATVSCVCDGAVSIYLSSGGGVIGAGEHEAVRSIGARALKVAEIHAASAEVAAGPPDPPPAGFVQFVFVRADGWRVAQAPQAELNSRRHRLTDLYAIMQEVIGAIRERTPPAH